MLVDNLIFERFHFYFTVLKLKKVTDIEMTRVKVTWASPFNPSKPWK